MKANEGFIQTNLNVLMPKSLFDRQTKGPSIIERPLLYLQYFTKLINLLIRGRSQTTFTKSGFFFTTYPPPFTFSMV